jgi:hypothetical protein
MTATVPTPEAAALALRMRQHFGHKVPVELQGEVSRVRISAGEFELEPRGDSLAVRATAVDDVGLARVREVVGSHLARFARETDVELKWATLEARAEAWIDDHRNVHHLLRTRQWAVELAPEAPESLRLAALLHDFDRHAGDVSLDEQVAGWDDERRMAEHAERSARLASARLREAGADEGLIHDVEGLIRLHETGGTPDADVLQAADSLSFLEVRPAERWLREGLADPEVAERKLRWMHDRIQLAKARVLAGPLLAAALAGLPLAEQVQQQANEGRAHGNAR